ncbi:MULTISPECIES: glycosyltransferase [Sporosarcina]|uniref:glycosyltransferase n=1 Tax=Sporosarcina TaxID=1569 RepID=UPI00129AEB67|nr:MULTISPECIES: glycosyltransferase [Sporosarcina]GKV65011.1 glycosyl transferase [Sporosarcina sp. NCCP-2331]GLB56646.1 glycosyl transferase [Sporosarcina sp. NCCP-2378]
MYRKILFISDHGDPLEPLGSEQAGGQNNYVKQLALALEKEGYAVDVATHWNSLSTPQIEHFGQACRVIRIAAGKQEYVPKSKLFSMMPDFYQELVNTIPLESYELIHTHYWLSGLVGSFIQKDYQMPWIHTNHSLGIAKKEATGDSDALRLLTEKMILSSADHVVVTSKTEKELISKFVDKPSDIQVISIGVDKAFRPSQKRAGIRPYFAFAGRLQTTKGIYTLLKAFKLLTKKERLSSHSKLIIAGGGKDCIDQRNHLPHSKKLRSALRGIEHRVKFIGPQSQKQLAVLFENSIATIVPSYYESFGMVAAEAQACGSPVIASKVGGLQDVVKHGLTGLHVEHKNPEQLAEAMVTLLHNPAYTKTLGLRAGVYAQQEFNWSVLAYKMANLYKGACHEKEGLFTGN